VFLRRNLEQNMPKNGSFKKKL